MALRPKSCFILHLNSYIYLHDTVFMFIQDFESSISVVFKIFTIYFNSINSNFKSVEFICFVQILSELIVNNNNKKKEHAHQFKFQSFNVSTPCRSKQAKFVTVSFLNQRHVDLASLCGIILTSGRYDL